MKVLLVADGRSPITKHWIQSLQQMNIEVSLVSTFPCKEPEDLKSFRVLPAAFAGSAGNQAKKASSEPLTLKRRLIKRFRNLFMKARYILGPLTLFYYGFQFRKIVKELQPDLVHALRIPFEGMLASFLPDKVPFAVTIWGNDLTLHAKGSLLMRAMTKRVLRRANGLAADANRDIRLGHEWGFSAEKQTLVVPGSGGIAFTETRLIAEEGQSALSWLPMDHHIVINPRGFRPGSVRNDTFFKSIPLILSQVPNTIFVCPSMEGQPEAQNWVSQLSIQKFTVLLPTLTQPNLWALFKRAEVSISVSQHDGTPNSLLEAMTIGCFPVAGDIESVREWITPGINGMLVNPESPEQLAQAVISALSSPKLRASAAQHNAEIIRSRAEKTTVSAQIAVFYNQLTAGKIF